MVGPNVRYIWRNPTSDDFADKDYSSQGGGLLVEKGGTADLEDCNIFDNSAKDVCFEPAFRKPQLVLIVCRAVPWQGSESVHFEPSILNHSVPLMQYLSTILSPCRVEVFLFTARLNSVAARYSATLRFRPKAS